MSVGYILKLAGSKMGLDPSDTNSRSVLLRFLNEAAAELYMQADPPGSLVEQVFKINGDQTLSLPAYVGKIRGMREAASMQAWHVNQLRPRYNQFNWPDMWRNFRLRGKSPLMATVTNQSVGVITVKEVENPPIVITLAGPTADASHVIETITMDATEKETENAFLDYESVTKNRQNKFDVTLADVDGKVLTVIPNNELSSQYQIVDISSCPWISQSTSRVDNYIEVLYKKKLPYLSEDGDEYPAFDYDNVVVNKMMQLWMEEQNKADAAQLYDAKATRSSARINEDQNKATEDMVALVAHPHDTLLKRIGTGLRRRYNLYAGRKI